MKNQKNIQKVYNHLTVNDRPSKPEKQWQRSQTVPDQSIGLRDLLDRHSRGLSLSGFTPIYEEDFESSGINYKSLDLTDIQRMTRENNLKLQQLQRQNADEQITAKANKKAQELQQAKDLIKQAQIDLDKD